MYSGAAGNVGYHIPSPDESAVQRVLLAEDFGDACYALTPSPS